MLLVPHALDRVRQRCAPLFEPKPPPAMPRPTLLSRMLWAFLILTVAVAAQPAAAQTSEPLDRVMTLTSDESGARDLPADRGSTGLWQQLQKLPTTASVLHIVAHPDDEHGGVLAYLSRGQGARVALLSLNRGEGGANAIGSELFDALGLVRTEELLLAGAYYGLDDLYFTPLIDYGFSKTLDEALRNWGRESVLREVVRVIRINRPLVVLSRFHGSERDGHGHHQTAGVISQEAFRAAGDASRFPEQIQQEGLRPWQPMKLYRGGVQEEETWHAQIDAGAYSPWLGASYRNYASRGLSLQRSQMSGRYREVTGPYLRYYERMDATVEAPEKEASLFEGLDTSLPGLFDLLGLTAPPEAVALLEEIQAHAEEALAAVDLTDPAAVVPALAQGLAKTREALALVDDQPDVRFHLLIKEQQFMDALTTALGVRLQAVGVPGGTSTPESPWAPLPTMGLAVPGQTFGVEVTVVNPSPLPVRLHDVRLVAAPELALPDVPAPSSAALGSSLESGAPARVQFEVTVPESAAPSKPYFYRDSIQESQYAVRDSAALHLPKEAPPLTAVAEYTVEGVPARVRETVRTREAHFPYGYEWRALKIAPALAVNVEPAMRIVPVTGDSSSFSVAIRLVSNQENVTSGALRLETPEGWNVEPATTPFSFSGPGQEQRFTMQVTPARLEAGETYTLEAVAEIDRQTYRQGYDAIAHRDNDTQYLYRPATLQVRGVDVQMASDLSVGYVMGVGDEVPAGIEQLGADVQLLDADDLASADLAPYDAIVIGTRAYAVRPDLRTSNPRLLEYARQGGNLIVLYQTSEFVPGEMAPYPASLPPGAEEVSEEDADVRLLAPEHPAFNQPNAITPADFDGWVEQRGSKFFSQWDGAYTPMLEMQDQGQDPQQGAWLTAEYGDGHYSYFALAVHRQLPYAVPGAYRLFANLLSLGQ